MHRWMKWILLSFWVALALAGCRPSTPAAVATPTALPAATQTPVPTAAADPTSTAIAPTPAVVVPTPTMAAPAETVVLNWQREGGIAGFCDQVTVYADGGVRVTSCQRQEVITERLSGAELDRVLGWVERFAPVEHLQSDGAVADGMTVRLTLAGQGAQAATEADVQVMRDLAAALVPLPQPPAGAVLQTSVRYVLANEDVPMVAGPGAGPRQIGEVFGGQTAWVTGISADGEWWRVICPDETVGDCWLSADPRLTHPTTPPGAWQTFSFIMGASIDYPAGWFHETGSYGETEQGVWFNAPEMDGQPVGVELYHRPAAERDLADPLNWQPNEGGYQVHWSRPIKTVQGLVGLEFVWGAYSEPQKTWDTPPQWMAVYYSPEHEFDVRVSTVFDPAALDLLETSGITETVTASFGTPRRMAQSIRLYPTVGWDAYRDTEADGLFELKHPAGWAVQSGGLECATRYQMDTLDLLVYEGCPGSGAGEGALTFFDTLQRFRAGFGSDTAAGIRFVNGTQASVIHYPAAGENGLLALDPGPGTVALWQVGEQGFALIDHGNRHQADGTFDGVLGSFQLLPPMPRVQSRPLEGRAAEGGTAFDLPGVGLTLVLPEGYGVSTNSEFNRRGSLVSFDFTPYGGATPRLGEIQFFSEASLRMFQARCDASGGFCFEGDYPDLERFQAIQAAMAQCIAPASFEAVQIGGRCYLVGTHRCMGDMCVLREYTTFLDEIMVSVITMLRDPSEVEASDRLFATSALQEVPSQ